MSAYRTPGARPVYDLLEEPDPFPPIACRDCERPTTSMNGEDLCAACDLRWLSRGIDWAILEREQVALRDPILGISCAYCGEWKPWPGAFPSRSWAECHDCARTRFRLEERKTVAFLIARVGEIVYRILDARGIR